MNSWWWNVGETWMFWVCVAVAVAGLVIGALWADDFDGPVFGGMIGGFCGLLASVVLWWAGVGFFGLVLPHHDYTSRHDLVILQDTSTVSGSVVLGSGYLKDDPAFSFYTRENGYSQYLIVASNTNTKIYEDVAPGGTPWLVTLDDCALWGKVTTCFTAHRWINEIHIPPNTIKPGLTLDGAR